MQGGVTNENGKRKRKPRIFGNVRNAKRERYPRFYGLFFFGDGNRRKV